MLDIELRNNKFVDYRIDYFLIWGHGVKYKKQIISILEKEKDLEILKIIPFKPKNIKKFVKEVYSYDYAPFFHLKAKTKYLLKTPKLVYFIFVKNIDPKEDFFGEGSFLHYECTKIKKIKNYIRELYNDRKNGVRSENHVIHASDNEGQTHKILKYLGFKNGIYDILPRNDLFMKIPHHIKTNNTFILKKISIEKIYANIIFNDEIKSVSIYDTPQFKTLINNDFSIYEKYLEKYPDKLTDYYSIEKYKKLINTIDEKSYYTYSNFIIVKKIIGKYIILDGVHRASILAFKGNKSLMCVEVI